MSEQTQNQKQEQTQNQKQEQAQNQKQAQEQKKEELKNVNLGVYERFCELYFIKIDGAKLKDSALNEMKRLEREIRSCKGKKPAVTVTSAIGNEKTKLVAGLPVPKEIENIINDSKNPSYYWGK